MRAAMAVGAFVAMSGCERRESDVAVPGAAAEPELVQVDPAVLANAPPGVDPELVRAGHAHFLVCTVCHGPEGEGTPLGPSLRDGQWIHISGEHDEILQVIRDGIDPPREYPVPMPEMGGGAFDPEELSALSAYVFALSRTAP